MRWPLVLFSVCSLTACMFHDREEPEPNPDDPDYPDPDPEPPAPPAGGKRLFVTRGAYRGALAVDDARGIAAGDLICNLRAKAAGLGGTWVAWLSSSTADAIDRVTSLGPWRTLDNKVAFEQRAQLYGEPLVPLNRDERGVIVGDARIWTGTRAGGMRSVETCDDWLSTANRGRYGHDAQTFDWTDYSFSYCTDELRLLCIEL